MDPAAREKQAWRISMHMGRKGGNRRNKTRYTPLASGDHLMVQSILKRGDGVRQLWHSPRAGRTVKGEGRVQNAQKATTSGMQAIQQSMQMVWWYMLQTAANGNEPELTLFHQAVLGVCRGSPAQARHLDRGAGNSPAPNAEDVRTVLIKAEDKGKIIGSK